MSRTIGVIGLGHVGVTTSFNLLTKGLADKLVIFETKAGLAEGQAYDLRDALGGLDTYTEVVYNDYSQLKDADVVVFAAGDISGILGGDRNSEIATSKQAVDEVAPQLKDSGFHGILVDISNPCDVITSYWQEKLDFPKTRIFGTGTALDTYRMRRSVADELNVNVADVRGFSMGEHGEKQFAAWSTVRVNNQPILEMPGVDYAALAEDARLGGWKIFNAKHFTAYGIATIATEIVGTICSDAKRVFPVTCYDENLGFCIGHPAVVGRAGIIANPAMNLTAEEQQKYDEAAQSIRETYDKLKALD